MQPTSTYNKVRLTITSPVGVSIPLQFQIYYAFGNSSAQCLNGVLPVVLSSFEVEAGNNCGATVSWSTAGEANNERFIAQRRRGMERHWSDIASVRSHGRASATKSYRYYDVSFNDVKAVYRIACVSQDGHQTCLMRR